MSANKAISSKGRIFVLTSHCCGPDLHAMLETEPALRSIRKRLSNDRPQDASILMVAGPLLPSAVDTLRRVLPLLKRPRTVVSIGPCASRSGPFQNTEVPQLDEIVPVDMVIPGCPPSVEDLADLM